MTTSKNEAGTVIVYHSGSWEQQPANVIREQAVSLTVNNETWLTLMCTPVDLEALAIGFLFNEEIIETVAEVASLRVCPENDNVDVWLNSKAAKPEHWSRTSGCSGGQTSVKNISHPKKVIRPGNGAAIQAGQVGKLMKQLLDNQELYRKSGGVHTSALSDGEHLLLVAEDIGRHNTLDKLAGLMLLRNIHPARRTILTTGRISAEMIQKARRMRASIVISRTSPTSESIRMAQAEAITLVGYAHQDRFIIYTHPQRILSAEAQKINSEAL